jgi:Kef-type K+ transport system membrane component KefB
VGRVPPDWLLVVIDLVLIVAVAQLGGTIAARLGQPRIAGEMLAVVCIGPTVLGGRIAEIVPGQSGHGAVDALFPEPVVSVLALVGGLGLVLYMLLVGITIDPAPLRRRAGAIGLLGAAIIGSTVAVALVVGPWLVEAGGWKPAGVAQGAFVLALAAGLAANGVPIVARILEERGLLHSEVGAIVIVSAACVTGLALLASAVAIDGGDAAAGGRVGVRIAGGLLVLVVVLMLARARRIALPPALAVAAVLALAVASAVAGDRLISSALIGPLVVGVAVPARGAAARVVEARLGVVVRRVLLPVFLGVAALHTDLRELGGGDVLGPALAIIAAVIVIKLAVGHLAARLAGFDGGEARAIGALLQCGGIMTIAISLDVLQAGVIGLRLHATLTLVGLISTLVAGPLLARARLPRAVAPAPAH